MIDIENCFRVFLHILRKQFIPRCFLMSRRHVLQQSRVTCFSSPVSRASAVPCFSSPVSRASAVPCHVLQQSRVTCFSSPVSRASAVPCRVLQQSRVTCFSSTVSRASAAYFPQLLLSVTWLRSSIISLLNLIPSIFSETGGDLKTTRTRVQEKGVFINKFLSNIN